MASEANYIGTTLRHGHNIMGEQEKERRRVETGEEERRRGRENDFLFPNFKEKSV